METLFNGYILDFSPGAFPLSTDSMVLSGFVRLPKGAKVLDLGSGCGALGHLLCANDAGCRVTGVEIDSHAHAAALENIHRNGLEDRLESICADLRQIPSMFPAGSFSLCVSNPPYFSSGPESRSHPSARKETLCSMEQLFQAAAWAVKYGGDFCLVHRPERLGELFGCAAAVCMEPKRLCLVRHDPASPVNLVLIQFRKGAKPGLLWEELCLMDVHGQPTEQYRKLYHL